MDETRRRIRSLFALIMLAFAGLIAWQSYWHLYASDELLDKPSNPRLTRAEDKIARGVIFDRKNRRLAWTESGKRQYADSRATSPVLGYIDPRFGRTGVEGAWDLELAGLTRNFTSAELQRILQNEKPRGNDLVLTIDLAMQQAATKALGEKRGAVVVLDPVTGGILAMSSSPSFDAAKISTEYETLSRRDDGPLRNRALQDHYPPGSTMKVVTAAAALMHDVSPDTRYTCKGKTDLDGVKIKDYQGHVHGSVNMDGALTHSCNYYFAHTAVSMGKDALQETASAFGFGKAWWRNSSAPLARMLPYPIASSSLFPAGTRNVLFGDLAQMGFGQSTVVATPLQMAMVCAGVANNGKVMAPFVVRAVRKGSTDISLETFESTPVGYPLGKDRANALAGMMRHVVTGGTARGADVRGVMVYGKTGTAQQTGGEDHAWFVGFAERTRDGKSERIAFAVVIERGGTGGRVAVPVAREVIEKWAGE